MTARRILRADFGFGRAHRFNVFLVQDDVVRPGRQVEHALLRHGRAVEESKQEFLWVLQNRRRVSCGVAATWIECRLADLSPASPELHFQVLRRHDERLLSVCASSPQALV